MNICECCYLLLANNDDSSCRDYHEHDHPYGAFGPYDVPGEFVETMWSAWVCDACASSMLPGSNVFEAVDARVGAP